MKIKLFMLKKITQQFIEYAVIRTIKFIFARTDRSLNTSIKEHNYNITKYLVPKKCFIYLMNCIKFLILLLTNIADQEPTGICK